MPTMVESLVADGFLVLSLAVHAELLARLRRADAPKPAWWFGYARDGTNLAAMLMYLGAYLGLHFAGPVAFLAAALTTLVTYMLDWFFARGLRLQRVRLALAMPLGLWVAVVSLRPAPIASGLWRLIAGVQPVGR
jgi:hypothetical protein